MPNKTTLFNPFDYMDTQDEINYFLRECLEDDAPNVFFQHWALS